MGEIWSLPLISPLATAGVVPMTVTNRIAASDSWNSRIDHGTHATDGIVWRPVMSDPNAARRTRMRATARPMAVPSTTAME